MATSNQFAKEAARLLASTNVKRYARRWAGDDADDVLQDAALKLFGAFARGYQPRSVVALVFLAVMQAAINLRKASATRREGLERAALDPAMTAEFGLFGRVNPPRERDDDAVELVGPARNVEAEVIHEIDTEHEVGLMLEALEAVPEQWAEQLRLTYLDATAPATRQRGIPVGSVVSMSHRAKAKVRERMADAAVPPVIRRRAEQQREAVERAAWPALAEFNAERAFAEQHGRRPVPTRQVQRALAQFNAERWAGA